MNVMPVLHTTCSSGLVIRGHQNSRKPHIWWPDEATKVFYTISTFFYCSAFQVFGHQKLYKFMNLPCSDV